ncbi:aconitate hydratase [Halomonas cupida]|uniref:Aconitate hydratase n=1 Tax=Halomonas cupida TaxID=44933 RepID=A0A1M6ZIR1_9GAMM|nr:aconitate hydratase AcnA [Halomonas cupida]GEN24346.1 aconitate hydratase [Halomonas cupida]SHL30366.1 aconitate hydratase [Halomonas cupida]
MSVTTQQARQQPSPRTLRIAGQDYHYIDLSDLVKSQQLEQMPYSLRLLLENVARRSPDNLPNLLAFLAGTSSSGEVNYYPNRLMFHDTTCLPALADFAGLRDAVHELGGKAENINPSIPAVLAIDHSVIVEEFDHPDALARNLDIDFRRNAERYRFIKWAERSLDNFSVVPPGTGIIHQVNMESLAQVVWTHEDDQGRQWIHPDNMVATDSHTPMINALGILAWGVGGLEGQAAMLGEPVTLTLPEVIGIRLTGRLSPTVTAMDLALHIAELLRAEGVVGKFVEFCGPGLSCLSWAARGTVANMAPEYGATVMFFPFDDITMDYLELSGRSPELREQVATYLEKQGLWRRDESPEPHFTRCLDLDLTAIEASVAGPHQPHERHALNQLSPSWRNSAHPSSNLLATSRHADLAGNVPDWAWQLDHGAVAIAAITSCTNTANPAEMIQAGLLARRARQRGLTRRPWVKTSLSPGSRIVGDYLEAAELQADFDAIGFAVTGFGCMTCIGNSGGLIPEVDQLVRNGLDAVAVLSGNRNFQGRVNPILSSGYLMSPALVVAYALAGDVTIDITREPLCHDAAGKPVYLHELMPDDDEVERLVRKVVVPEAFSRRNATLWDGTDHWRQLDASGSLRFDWAPDSTYLRRPRYLESVARSPRHTLSIASARVIMQLGDNVTTDHISPAGAIPADSLAGRYLLEHGESAGDLNQYSTRRSNHEVMLRGAFTNSRVDNQLPGTSSGGKGVWARPLNQSSPEILYEAAQSYVAADIPLVVVAGINYGAGSSRDWAAKAQSLLGVRAVIAQSFERIHRSNLIGMGILPLRLPDGSTPTSLSLDGEERLDIDVPEQLSLGINRVHLRVLRNETIHEFLLDLQIDSDQELRYLWHGGILPYVVRKQAGASQGSSPMPSPATPSPISGA